MSDLTAPRLEVTLADDRVLELQTLNPDLVRWDLTRPVEKWPAVEAAPMLWMTFIAWCAARRTGVYTDKFEKWHSEDCVNITDLDDEDEAQVGPTQPTPGPDSA